jgi:hypothetical protein
MVSTTSRSSPNRVWIGPVYTEHPSAYSVERPPPAFPLRWLYIRHRVSDIGTQPMKRRRSRPVEKVGRVSWCGLQESPADDDGDYHTTDVYFPSYAQQQTGDQDIQSRTRPVEYDHHDETKQSYIAIQS